MQLRHPAAKQGKKIVVVVGGGFAGLNVAKSLANEPDVYVILLDQRNHHLFQPLLYQVATAGLNPSDIAVPIRAQFSDAANVEVHLAQASRIDLANRTIEGEGHTLHYDYLVLACGAQHSYFGHQEWERFAPGLKTLEHATAIRRRILLAFESAENEMDPKIQQSYLTFVVVGGGPTGVELAGAIADISRTVLVKDFKRIDASSARVILVEAADGILRTFSPKLSASAKQDLHDIGVEIRLGAKVNMIDADGVQINEEHIPAKSVFWAAGVQAASLEFSPPVLKDPAGRVHVSADFSIASHPEVFVVGDMAHYELSHTPGKSIILPGLAPAAIQSGKFVANRILELVRGKKASAFKYFDKGQMATIGKRRAIAEAGKLQIRGFIAWMAWLFVHVFYLIGFKNRVAVMTLWAWSYIFSKRGARLITGNVTSVS